MKLYEAVQNNDLELAKKLIKEGYPLDEKNIYNNTALIIVSRYGRVEIVKELIKAGASLNMKDDCNKTAFDYYPERFHSFDIQDIILNMYPDKYSLLEEKVGIHKDIILKLKMKQILELWN